MYPCTLFFICGYRYFYNRRLICAIIIFQGSADSNYSQPSSELSLDEEKESDRRKAEAQALLQLDKARVSSTNVFYCYKCVLISVYFVYLCSTQSILEYIRHQVKCKLFAVNLFEINSSR